MIEKHFTRICREAHDLGEISGLLEWDQSVMMPEKGAQQKGHQQAVLARLIHEKWRSPELGDLVEQLEDRHGLDPGMEADLREVRRRRDRALVVPDDLVAERAMACTISQSVWETAFKDNDFKAFKPHLEKVVRLTREMALCIDGDEPYDALLDEYEPGAVESELRPLFGRVRERTEALLDRLKGASSHPDRSIMERRFAVEAQESFVRGLATDMGFDWSAGRLDASTHPFTIGTLRDVRITTRYDPDNLATALFATMHEAGHALYEQGLDAGRYRDPSGRACSLGIHESQSRFWENLIGRSRPFWENRLPTLKEAFPGLLDDVSPREIYRAVNVCEPSLVRVEADEVTYNLHVILRFELESDLVAGRIQVADLPGAWNEKMVSFLGIRPPDDRLGVLQDVHWSAGLFGYFPTYTLGNLYAAQFMEALRGDLPDLDGRLSRGDLASVREWLREKIHCHGRKYLAGDLCRRVTGEPLSPEPSMSYLDGKFSDIYGV